MLSDEFRTALLGVVARAAELRETFDEEVQARRDAAVGERLVSGGTEGLLSALPLAARLTGRNRVGRWLREGENAQFGGRVLLDAQGRPLLHEGAHGEVRGMWRYEADRVEQVDHRRAVTWVLQPHGAVGGDDLDRWVERWTWQGDQVVRVDRARASPRGWAGAVATQAELDAAGALRVLRYGFERNEYREDNRLGEDEWLPALEAALERAGGVACERVEWIAARDAPAPLRADVSGLAEELAGALADAIAAAAAEAALPEPFYVQITGGGDHSGRLPPSAILADDRWRRGNIASAPGDLAAIDHLWQGKDSGDVVELDLTDWLDDAALRGCAEIDQALDLYADPAETARAGPVQAELADRLTALLAEPGRIPRATPEFLGLVHFGEDKALGRARRVLGEARVRRFLDTLRSQAPVTVPAGLAEAALRDRGALERLLAARGLAAHAHRIAHEVAEVGLLLRAGEGHGSRLGGPPLLPPGEEWPATADGRPLSFLAGIDLGELPAADGRPDAGWWLFLADLDVDENDYPLCEPESNLPGARARLLPVPAGVTPAPAAPQGEELNHVPVAFEPMLTIPNHWGAAETLGLDVYEARAYEAVVSLLWEATGESEWFGGQHWIGGHASGAQGETAEPGSVLLLHMADDSELGFYFLDAGTLQFRIPADALARGDYGAVTAEPSSC